MSNFFKIFNVDELSRAGEIVINDIKIQTPCFMPVATQASVKSLDSYELTDIGYKLILSNIYHLSARPGIDYLKKFGGLHKFMNWKLPILTDSGGYQIWSLSKLKKIEEKGIKFRSHIDGKLLNLTPEKCIKFQQNIGSDIIMALDECPNYHIAKSKAESSMKLTLRWAKRSKKAFNAKSTSGIFGIIQGSKYEDLRIKCALGLQEIDFHGYAIGGVSVGEGQKEMLKIVKKIIPFLPEDKPRYLMGVGMPWDIVKSVHAGIDMFDCVLPTRLGRTGLAFTTSGIINIRNSKFKNDKSSINNTNLKENCNKIISYMLDYI